MKRIRGIVENLIKKISEERSLIKLSFRIDKQYEEYLLVVEIGESVFLWIDDTTLILLVD